MKDFAERYLRLLRETPVEDIVFVAYSYLDDIWRSHDKRVILEGDTKESCAECYGDIKYRMCELHQLPIAHHVIEFYNLWKDYKFNV